MFVAVIHFSCDNFTGEIALAIVAAGHEPGGRIFIEGAVDLVVIVNVEGLPLPFFTEFVFEYVCWHVVSPIAVPVGAPGKFGGFEQDACAFEVGMVVARGEYLVYGVIEFGEFAVIFEWLLIQVVFGNGLKALGLWSCDFVGDFSRFVGDAAKICEE